MTVTVYVANGRRRSVFARLHSPGSVLQFFWKSHRELFFYKFLKFFNFILNRIQIYNFSVFARLIVLGV